MTGIKRRGVPARIHAPLVLHKRSSRLGRVVKKARVFSVALVSREAHWVWAGATIDHVF